METYRPKFSCLTCKKEFQNNNYQNHIDSKSCKINKIEKISDSRVCPFCGREFNTILGTRQHEVRCSLNPNHRPKIMPKGRAAWNKGQTKDTNDKIAQQGNTLKYRIESGVVKKTARLWTDDEKAKQSIRMSEIAATSESYSGRYNRGSVKEVMCRNGFKVLGSWEELFVNYCLDNNIRIEQPSTPFSYTYEDKERMYYPDFYLPVLDCYVEIKGYESDKDKAKWHYLQNVHQRKLLVIKARGINDIKNGCFKLS